MYKETTYKYNGKIHSKAFYKTCHSIILAVIKIFMRERQMHGETQISNV